MPRYDTADKATFAAIAVSVVVLLALMLAPRGDRENGQREPGPTTSVLPTYHASR